MDTTLLSALDTRGRDKFEQAIMSAVLLPHGKWGVCGIDYATG